MNSDLSLVTEKSRRTFLVHYTLSVFMPILIMIFAILEYVVPYLSTDQIEHLRSIFVYGLAAMISIPLLSFFLMFGWLRLFENLTKDIKSRSAELLESDAQFDEENEMLTLHHIFNTLQEELEGKIGQLNEYSKKLIESNKKFSELAIRDELTTLYNRRHFDLRLTEETNRAERYTRDLSLIMIDVDGFKQYNDSHGYSAGDKLLKDIGFLIQNSVRKSDISFRYGGDEFTIICPECKVEDARNIAHKLVAAVTAHSFEYDGSSTPQKMSISCGVASYSKGMSKLIDEADSCLYKARKNGEGGIVVSP